jgi:hypothetical protein
MNPEERPDRQPGLKFLALEKPLGRPLMVGFARNVVIRERIRRRQPVVDILFYLRPCADYSVSSSSTRVIRVGYHKHFISSTSRFTSTTSRFTSSMSLEICCMARLVLSAPTRRSVQCDVSDWSLIGPRTIFDLSSDLQILSNRHLDFLLYQAIEPLKCVLNICHPQ